MATIAPWIVPPDYLAAIRSGAGIGLNLRQQDLAEEEAANRFQQSYAHLAAQQDIAKSRIEAARQSREAAMALRAQQNDMINRFHQQEIENAQQRMQPKPVFHFGSHGEVLSLDPSDGSVKTLKQPDFTADPEEKEYERELRSAQSALDVAKRNADKMAATQTVETGGGLFGLIPKKTISKPVFPKEKGDQAKAALDAAQNLLDQKQDLLQSYRSSKGKKEPSGGTTITHRWNPDTQTLEPVSTESQ